MAHIRLQLMEVLVCHDQANPELAKLRDHVGYRERREGLELVGVNEEGAALGLRQLRPAEGGETNRGHEEGTQEVRAVLAKLTYPEIDDQDLSLVHDLSDMKVNRRLDEEPT